MARKSDSLFRELQARVLRMPAGMRLPSIRQLMREHEVSQATVMAALDQLKAKQYVASRAGDGIYTTQLREPATAREALRIGIASHDYPSRFHADLVQQVGQHLLQSGHQPLFHHFPWNSDQPLAAPSWQIDALLLLPCQALLDEGFLRHLRRLHLPLVLLDRADQEPGCDAVGLDNDTGGALAARHLIQQGHRRLAVLSAQPDHPVVRARIDGFRRQAIMSGIESVFVLDCDARPGDNSMHLACRRIADAARAGLNFTGLFCITDPSALGALSALHRAGINVPGEVSVVGFDNLPETEFSIPPLTTVSQNPHLWGEFALQAIRRRLEQPDLQPQRLIVTPTLVERESTTAPSQRSLNVEDVR